MRITIDRCPAGRFELAQARPAADLAGAVVRYAGYVESAAWTLEQREVAAPVVPLIINLGAAFRVRLGHAGDAGPAHHSFVAGLYDGYADVAALGPAHCLQIDLTPLGARRLLALPMQELAGRTVDLRLVAGRATDELAERLYHAPAGARVSRCSMPSSAPGWRPRRRPRLQSPGHGSSWSRAAGGCASAISRARSAGVASSKRCASRARPPGFQDGRAHPALRPGVPGDPRRRGRGRLGRPRAQLRLRRPGPPDPRVPGGFTEHAVWCEAAPLA